MLRLDDQLCFATYAASRAFTRAYAPLLAELGLTYPQYIVMIVLWEEDDRTVGALGDRLALDSGTLTPLLKRLEQAGLVTRHRDTDDERVVRVKLTTPGKKLESKAREIPTTLACRAGFATTKDGHRQIAELRGALRDLTRALDSTHDAPEAAPVERVTKGRKRAR